MAYKISSLNEMMSLYYSTSSYQTYSTSSYQANSTTSYQANSTTSCNSFAYNLLLQMADQGVDDVSKVNPSIPSSLDTKIPVLIQFKNRFDAINPVLHKVLMRNNNNSYMYQLSNTEFMLYDLEKLSDYLRNFTVTF